ncbi:MAG: thioredoxin family protein [Chloroflexota bacterium]
MISADTWTRALLTSGMILAGCGLYLLYNWMLSRRIGRGLLAELGVHHPGTLLIVYFSTPTCVPCKTIQRPTLEGIVRVMDGTVQILEIDASQSPDLASRWGVLSSPTTYVVDPHGKIRFVNHGVARMEKLLMQLQVAKQE